MHPPPPAYFPPKGWSPQFRRMSPNMLMAIEAVRSGKMGFTQAGKTFSVNGRTLWVYYRKLGYEVHNTFRGRRNKAPHALPHPQNAPETLPQDTQPPPPTGLQPQPCPGSSQHVQPQHHTLDTTHGLLDTTGQNGAGGTTGNPAPNTTAPENPPLDTVPQLKEESVGITGSLGDVGMGEGPLEQYGYLPPPPPHHHHLHHTPDISNEDLQTEDASRALQSLLESYNFRSMWGSPT
ncbi:hypothetical protein E2C01_095546 [Portunus trituberculatus]|uniref:HTH psq-type domain-containing protein n=1 Tax=Portunus trituberculatus TaxID=210409 RepID=A0A5B7JZP1_PORTR|nr:hypothetical protein [Portunus trituberculatus]